MNTNISFQELKNFLDEKVNRYNTPQFIESDPIQIPRSFNKTEDIEIAAFISATIAWGQRPTIIKNATKFLQLMDNDPFDFILNSNEKDYQQFTNFKHRTFNGQDAIAFLKSLKNIYIKHGGLQSIFEKNAHKTETVKEGLIELRKIFFEIDLPNRTQKHVANVLKNSSAKRLNMFLRWMVRNDNRGVDFGLWKTVNPSQLYIPLDIHSGNSARKLGLLSRTNNDWQAVEELTKNLKQFDPLDPVKYDFALFGLGVFEKF